MTIPSALSSSGRCTADGWVLFGPVLDANEDLEVSLSGGSPDQPMDIDVGQTWVHYMWKIKHGLIRKAQSETSSKPISLTCLTRTIARKLV